MNVSTRKILIVSCGNSMAGDDALGPQVTALLRKNPPDNVRIVDLDMNPAGLMDHLDGQDALFIIDAVRWPGKEVASLIDLDWSQAKEARLANDDCFSTHGFSIANQIELAENLKILPPTVRLFGLIVDSTEIGKKINDPLEKAVPDLLERIRTNLQQMS